MAKQPSRKDSLFIFIVTDSGETLRVCRHLYQVNTRIRSTCVGADSLYGGLLSDAINTCISAVKIKQYAVQTDISTFQTRGISF
jgi:hypothetical protein